MKSQRKALTQEQKDVRNARARAKRAAKKSAVAAQTKPTTEVATTTVQTGITLSRPREGYTQFDYTGCHDLLMASHTLAAMIASRACTLDHDKVTVQSGYRKDALRWFIKDSAMGWWKKQGWLDDNGLTELGCKEQMSRISGGRGRKKQPNTALVKAFLSSYLSGKPIEYDKALGCKGGRTISMSSFKEFSATV